MSSRSAGSDDRPLGERSIEYSDSESSDNSDSESEESELSYNSDSDSQASELSDNSDSEPSGSSDSDSQVSETSDDSDSDLQVSEPSENSDSDRRLGKSNKHMSQVSDEPLAKRHGSSGRMTKPAVDLMDQLPDSLLGHVLSFLPIEDTIKTQVLSSMDAKGFCSTLNCTSLTLKACLSNVFPGIEKIFRLSPNLETLVMTKLSSPIYQGCWTNQLHSYNIEHYWTSKYLSLHLKKVAFADISWFHYKSNFSFVRFLLKNAKVLQKVIINDSMLDDEMPKEFVVAANKLLTFPRSSPDAVVMFCQ